MKFPCTGCGQCCRKLGVLMILKKALTPGKPFYDEVHAFPYEPDASGACPQLTPAGACAVYENRPDACNIERIRGKYFAHMPEGEYFKLTAENCNTLIDQAQIDESYKIKMPQ